MKQTLYEKLFNSHIVYEGKNEAPLLYVDRHLIHEVTSPQAFEGLRMTKRKLRQSGKTIATMDHNVPTDSRDINGSGQMGKIQMTQLKKNTQEFGIRLFDIDDINQGIVHILGPEQGLTLPGMSIVCGDSHTATHGAFGALAFGIGTSEVEHVFATQTIKQHRSKTLKIQINGELQKGVFAKDIILYIIGELGMAGGTGHVVEFCGEAIKNLSMEGRMTICNMAIELGAKSGLIAPDEMTINYLKNRPFSPKGKDWEDALEYWKSLKSDEGAKFDKAISLNAKDIAPQVTWGTNPGQVMGIDESIPCDFSDTLQEQSAKKALQYMGLKAGMKMSDVSVDKVFIGSCTNARIEDLRAAAEVVRGKKVSSKVEALVVAGSGLVKAQAQKEGLDKIFKEAGFEWREPGCSMCLAMNYDKLSPYQRCASTSNRNFEGRQGRNGRTHLLSPAMAAAAAIYGKFVDIRSL